MNFEKSQDCFESNAGIGLSQYTAITESTASMSTFPSCNPE